MIPFLSSPGALFVAIGGDSLLRLDEPVGGIRLARRVFLSRALKEAVCRRFIAPPLQNKPLGADTPRDNDMPVRIIYSLFFRWRFARLFSGLLSL